MSHILPYSMPIYISKKSQGAQKNRFQFKIGFIYYSAQILNVTTSQYVPRGAYVFCRSKGRLAALACTYRQSIQTATISMRVTLVLRELFISTVYKINLVILIPDSSMPKFFHNLNFIERCDTKNCLIIRNLNTIQSEREFQNLSLDVLPLIYIQKFYCLV